MTKTKTILKVSLIVFTILVSLGLFGYMSDINQGLESIIEEKPLANYYFIFFLISGLLFPIGLRFSLVNTTLSKVILEPYLLLMISQVLTEICLVFLFGKALGVIVGYIFSIIRLIQLKQLYPYSKASKLLQFFVIFQGTIWSYNIGHITLNRFLPFLTS